ncbi:MAG: C45 family autoproteolytic acyltransferase/hydrolase [Planctomycetota bacterium]|jgi:hypothetical protein
MHTCTRRAFLDYALKGAAGLGVLPLGGCAFDLALEGRALHVPPDGYPLVEAGGSYREIGRGLGSAMNEKIQAYFDESPDFPKCLDYLHYGGRERLDAMLEHVKVRFPHLVEELEGMAEALNLPLMVLFAYNCRSEIAVLTQNAGCSTLALKSRDRAVLAHNEDGNDTNAGRMYVAKVHPPNGVDFISFVYPGLLPGNGPGFNIRGVVQTTNYIQPRSVVDGIPRYFIGRAVLEAKSLDEAVGIITGGPRAYPWHHNLASLPDARLLSLETMPDRHHLQEVEGLMVHTNHLLHPEMTLEGAGEQDVPYESSTTRYRVLTQAIARGPSPVDSEEMLELLCLHEGKPYSPCRHPEGDVHGITLGTAVFEAPQKAMTLFHGNPCRGFKKRYSL